MGFRGVCRSRHSVLEPLRITLTQLKETLLLPLAHRMNPAERRSQKTLAEGFWFHFRPVFGYNPGAFTPGKCHGASPYHPPQNFLHPPRPSPELPSPSLRTKLLEGEVRDEVERDTE